MRRLKFRCEDCGEMVIKDWRMWCRKYECVIGEAKYRCEKCVVNCGYEG
jgi:hypothetical protein